MLAMKPRTDASGSLQMFTKALELEGKLENRKLWCAYTYVLAA
jgi:hypothetical protein